MAELLFSGQAAGGAIYKGIPVEKFCFSKRRAVDRFPVVLGIEYCLFRYVLVTRESKWRNIQD